MNKNLWAFVALAFVFGICLGVLWSEKKTRYQMASTGIPQSCWILDTHTGRLYLKGVDSSGRASQVDFGKPGESYIIKTKLETLDVDSPAKSTTKGTARDGRSAISDSPPEQ